MKKIIMVLIMMLVASVGYGKKYKDNVASRIVVTVNKVSYIGMDVAGEFVTNLRKKGIKPTIRYKWSGNEEWLVKVENIRLTFKVEFNSLDEDAVTECFDSLYDKMAMKPEKRSHAYRSRERDYAAEGAWRLSMYRLTGNPSWLAW